MADSTLTIPVSHVAKDLTVHVKVIGMRVFRFRTWCGIQLIKLAAVVAGVNIHVESDREYRERE